MALSFRYSLSDSRFVSVVLFLLLSLNGVAFCVEITLLVNFCSAYVIFASSL